ncbi:MAG: Ig-like domain-containing protein [Gemmatimonadaceae bacterium]|nr:Ig-like domain-containing protein [Gloeobacterales cyanobacterium ES-bin-141]
MLRKKVFRLVISVIAPVFVLLGITEAVFAQTVPSNFALEFDAAVPGTIADKDGEGTGFSSVQPNSLGTQYNPSLINLTPGNGILKITATQGDAGTDNLKNALQVPAASNHPFKIRARLKGPFTNLNTAYQQAGIYLGTSEDNYVKFVILNTGNGTGRLGLQFYQEQNGENSPIGTTSTGSQVTNLDWANITDLELSISGDPSTGIITAAYRLNNSTAPPVTLSQQFAPGPNTFFFDGDATVRAGIVASTSTAANVTVTYGSFGIQYGTRINFQPDTSTIPAGYREDIGQAYGTRGSFGWVREDSISNPTTTPLSVVPNSRDRNRSGIDQRLDTLIHMQFPPSSSSTTAVKTPAAWEYALPNGTYTATVSVGDKSPYDSTHSINVEGVNAIDLFQGNSSQEYKKASIVVEVSDGRLTVDAGGGTNTKINYVDIVPGNMVPRMRPTVTGTSPSSGATGVVRNAAVIADVSLPNTGAGVEETTLNTTNVKLFRTSDGVSVSGTVNTSGGGDTIVYQPSALLSSNTNYTVQITDKVRDQAGSAFIAHSLTFTTGSTTSVGSTTGVSFGKSQVYSGAALTSLAISPDGNKLYAAAADGKIRRWTIDSQGTLSNLETLSISGLAGRAIIGLVFDPENPSVLWISHNDPIYPQPAKDFTGKISKLNVGGSTVTIQNYIVGLPRSAKDHLSNSLAFGPDGKLYMAQGSNSAMGAPDDAWANRQERLLSASVLQIDPRRTSGLPINVQTESYEGIAGSYNPFASNAPVKIYATGVRNAYDLVWHSNGSLYTPANGSAANGNTPASPTGVTPSVPAVLGAPTQDDFLFKVVQSGYYGHPNPLRDEYAMNGANPTSGVDPAEVVAEGSNVGYSVGVQPDTNYRFFAWNFGRNRSPNGVIEYMSGTFGGALAGKLLVAEYSAGDDVLALTLNSSGNVSAVTQIATGLTNPLDLIEDISNGNVYVIELVNLSTGTGRITLLKPQ